jgi:hypothetical protein
MLTTNIKREEVIGGVCAKDATPYMMKDYIGGVIIATKPANGMKTEGEFYPNDVALLLISNESGSEVFAEVKVLERFNEYGRVRYLVEPIAGRGKMKVEKLVKIKK